MRFVLTSVGGIGPSRVGNIKAGNDNHTPHINNKASLRHWVPQNVCHMGATLRSTKEGKELKRLELSYGGDKALCSSQRHSLE